MQAVDTEGNVGPGAGPGPVVPPSSAAVRDRRGGPAGNAGGAAGQLAGQPAGEPVTVAVPHADTLATRAKAHTRVAQAPRTRRAYAADWAHFTGWCTAAGLDPLPAAVDTVRRYLVDLAATRTADDTPAFAPATLTRRLAAIAAAHRDAGHPSPTRDPAVRAVPAGITRAHGHTPHRMRPLLLADLRTLLASFEFGRWPGGLAAARDAVVILAGFAGALHRGELGALTAGDLCFAQADGLHLRLRSAETDPHTPDVTVVLPYGTHAGTCPPCAVLRWLQLLEAAQEGRAALMRAVLATPPWPEQTHLYPHPPPGPGQAPDPAAGPSATGTWGPVPVLPAAAPLLRGIRRGATLTDTGLTGHALHALIRRRAHTAGLPGPVGFHSLRAGFTITIGHTGTDHHAAGRPTRHTSNTTTDTDDRDHPPPSDNATRLGL